MNGLECLVLIFLLVLGCTIILAAIYDSDELDWRE
jgi:hypothetical protein|nr:MAG TPA: hypothetical protein [Caudoviricetes sp.]